MALRSNRIYANPPDLAGNLLTSPKDFTGTGNPWGAVATVATNRTGDAAMAPDGSGTADLVIPTATSTASHFVSHNTITVSAGNYRVGLRAKPAGYGFINIAVADSNGYTRNAQVIFDIFGGRIVSNNIGATYITNNIIVRRLTNGWVFCGYDVYGTVANSTHRVDIYIGNNNTVTGYAYSGDTVSGVYLWNAEFAPVPN